MTLCLYSGSNIVKCFHAKLRGSRSNRITGCFVHVFQYFQAVVSNLHYTNDAVLEILHNSSIDVECVLYPAGVHVKSISSPYRLLWMELDSSGVLINVCLSPC